MRILKNLLIVLLVVWGLLALAARLATPFIADHREQLAALVSEHLGAPVTIDTLKARWYGLGPLLELHGVTIGGDTRPLKIASISLKLAPLEMLTGSALDALRVTIVGMQLTLVREASGQLHLEGIGLIGQDSAEAPRSPLLPSRFRLVDTRVVWIDRKAGKSPLQIDKVDVVLDRDGSRLALRARLETGSGRADLSAQLDGFLTTRTWGGETYLKVDNLDIADLFAHYLSANYGLRGMQLDLESWGSWRDAAPVENQGEFRLRDLQLHPVSGDALPLDLAEASAGFTLRHGEGGLQIGLKDLQLMLDDRPWPAGDLALELKQQADGSQRISAAADYLRIEDVARILQVRLPMAGMKQPLQGLQPRGVIRGLRLVSEIASDRFDWRAQAHFEGIGTEPWGEAPGVSNLSGGLHGQQDHMVVQLDSLDASVRFKDLFRDPLVLLELEGRLDIQRQGDGWLLFSERILADTPHILTRSRVRLEKQPQRPLFLDLQTDFSEGDASYALRYYPASIMDSDLVAWLDSAIRSGRVPDGSALVYGSLVDFPFEDPSNGVFQVVFDARDLQLDYLQGWPRLEHVDAHVKFNANSLAIDLQSARVYDSQVLETTAHVDRLSISSPLRMRGRVEGPLQDILRVLQEDALRADFGDVAAALRGEGDSQLSLDFAIPLADEDKYELQGQLQFYDARLSLPDWDFAMNQVKGELNFDLDSLSAKGIRAQALGAPLTVDVLPLDGGATRVHARGRLKVERIQRQIPTLPLQIATGDSEFIIDVDIPGGGGQGSSPVVLSVESDLRGVGIDLPAPFGKKTDEARALAVRLPLGGRPSPGALNYADLVKARFSSDGKRVDVTLGGGEAALQPDPGVRIGGRLGQVDLVAWNQALEPLAGLDTGEPPPLSLDLQVERLYGDILGIDDLDLSARLDKGLWRGSLDAPDLAGSFVAPGSGTQSPIQVDLQRLHLEIPLGADESEPPPVPDTDSGPDPSTLSSLELSIAELQINEARLGKLRIDTQRTPEGLSLTRLSLEGGQLELDSTGHWSRSGSGYETRWEGRSSTPDLGELVEGLGYSRQVEGAGGNTEWLLQWPGNPTQFHRLTLAGRVGLEVDAGRVVELDPGVTRVIGLLNLSALTRRLRLDFSDIYKKGYSFDSIIGDFTFGTGKAGTENLRIVGPSGRIDISGSTDLMTRSLDQHVTVTPNLDATLPIASALAGGPVAGIAMLVAQKVMTKQVDQIYRFDYSVKGPWAEPEISQLESGGTLSRILNQFKGGGAQQATQAKEAPADDSSPASGPAAADEAEQAPAPMAATVETEMSTEAEADDRAAEAQPAEQPEKQNLFNDIFKVLKNSETHGSDLPGTSN